MLGNLTRIYVPYCFICLWFYVIRKKQTIKIRLGPTGRETQQISKGVNNAALLYVKQTVAMQIVLFYIWAGGGGSS